MAAKKTQLKIEGLLPTDRLGQDGVNETHLHCKDMTSGNRVARNSQREKIRIKKTKVIPMIVFLGFILGSLAFGVLAGWIELSFFGHELAAMKP